MSNLEGFFIRNMVFFLSFIFISGWINAQQSKYEKELDKLLQKGNEYLFSNKDSAYYYFDKIKIISATNEDWTSVVRALLGSNACADFNYDLDRLQRNINSLDTLFIAKKQYWDSLPNNEGNLYKIILDYEKGNYYFLLYDFKKSRQAFQTILNATENLPDSLLDVDRIWYQSLAYSYIAKMNSQEGKLDLAKQYYTKNIRLLMTKMPDNTMLLFGNYSLLAEVYTREKAYKKANDYLLKTLAYNVENINTSRIPSILNIVQNHLNLSQIDSAGYYLDIAKNLLSEKDPELSSFYQVSAEIHQKKKEYILAESDFNKALKLVKDKWNNGKHREIAYVANKIGLLHDEFDHPKVAIETYNIGIDQLSTSNSAINEATLVKILKNKAAALNHLKDKNFYASTLENVNWGIDLLDTLKPSFKSHSDKLFLIDDAFPLFESGLEAAYKLYQSSNDDKYLELAFRYSEKSKAVLLMDALLGAKATEFANIPSNLLERESQLKTEITFTEKQIINTKGDTGNLEDKLFDLREAYRQLVKKIETDYPAYYNLKYNTNTVSIAETQSLLADDESLISYFYGNNAVYAIALDKNSQKMECIVKDDSLEAHIKKMHNMLGDPKSDPKLLGKISYGLYSKLLAPFLNTNDKKKLVIISDGLLNYIPFSAFNTTQESLVYLAETQSISYANSASLSSQLIQNGPIDANILTFAPSFNGHAVPDADRAKLLPLPNNKKEVEDIMTSFKGKAFMDEDASLQNFRMQLGNFGIVHLATHAIFDDASPEDSYLAFAPKENGDNLLYVRDLYNLKSHADLVTLSACESGVGELRRGEGFLSLARGFFYSGASSICSTLWKINDASSTKLMDNFYKNLAEGDAKDLALQKAQVKFLNANRQNALAHPYYWSGFIISGNTQPLVNDLSWIWIALSSLLLIVLGILFYCKKRAA